MLATMMLPGQVIMIPTFLIWYNLGLNNTFAPLILPYFCGQAFFIYQMMQFMAGIPRELDEAATIDGCSKYSIFSHIILPLLKPSIVTTIIIQFYWKWDDYMGPLLYLSKPQSYTASLAIKMFADTASTTELRCHVCHVHPVPDSGILNFPVLQPLSGRGNWNQWIKGIKRLRGRNENCG